MDAELLKRMGLKVLELERQAIDDQSAGFRVIDVRTREPSLEDAFVELTRDPEPST